MPPGGRGDRGASPSLDSALLERHPAPNWARDLDDLISANRLIRPTRSFLSLSPRYHARDARAVTSGRPEEGSEPSPAPSRGLGSTPATIPVVAYCCGQEVRHNPVLRITFCIRCGRSGPFQIRVPRPLPTSFRLL